MFLIIIMNRDAMWSSVPVMLSELERCGVGAQFIQHMYTSPIRQTVINFDIVMMWGEVFVRVRHAHVQRGRASMFHNLGFPSTHAYTFWHWRTKFDLVTHIGEGLVFRGSSTPPFEGAQQTHNPYIGDPTTAHTVWLRASKFSMVTQMGRIMS